MSDEHSLLAAIVADPDDDTVRLAYADCIEENGDASRAEFIRLQIAAERLHPDSNARERLERQCLAIFAVHWMDWWRVVCDGVGLPKPTPPNAGVLGLLGRLVGAVAPAGDPYEVRETSVWPGGPVYDSRLGGWAWSQFRRGFPDLLEVSLPNSHYRGEFLRHWPTASPLSHLIVAGANPETWTDGPHLAGVRSLDLTEFDEAVVRDALASPHLTGLRELTLRTNDYGTGEAVALVGELAGFLTAPRVRQLERLSVPVWVPRAARALADSPHVAGVRALHVELEPETREDAGPPGRVATLAASRHLGGLREFSVDGILDYDDARALTQGATWKGLRKLSVADLSDVAGEPGETLDALLGEADLPHLDELRLEIVPLSREVIDLLVRSPLLKQLRHLSMSAWNADGVSGAEIRRLADVVDPTRIETFALQTDHAMPELAVLRERFGDRVRITGAG